MADTEHNRKTTPPPTGNWIVVDLQGHQITLFEDGKPIPQSIKHFSIGRKSQLGHEWLTHMGDAEILPNRRIRVGHRSNVFKDPNNPKLGALMNYALFFNNHGQAFHEGDVKIESHGCIHLNKADAVRLFEWVGDKKVGVRIVGPYSHQHSLRELSSKRYA